MRFDLRSRLAREQGRPAQRGAACLPFRCALLCGVVAAAWLAGAQGAVAQASHDAASFAPATAVTADLVDVPFFNSARTVWGGLRAMSAMPFDAAPDSQAARADPDGPGARLGACAPYRVLCDAARDAIERNYAARFDYGLASPLPVTDGPATFEPRSGELASGEPFTLAEPNSGTRIGAIAGSLQASLASAELPAGMAGQISRMLAGRVDVTQRGWTGDAFRVAFDADDDATLQGGSRVTALDLRFRGQQLSAVWFAAEAGAPGGYYDLDGMPFAGSRFVMPVDATRVSSRFGARVHPVTGATHVHSGVDLAAPAGRAVHASENGTVSFIGTEPRGYGKYVVVRHDAGYTSYYAHLSAFEPALRIGARVARGHRVGAIGSTGTATGPHLHFEVRRHNRPVDAVALMQASTEAALKGEQRVVFDRVAGQARVRLAAASWSPSFAMLDAAGVNAG
ncbi:M23 family metallopeptidase [Burkholderia stagnalis]|uniref:M23 family metallopeptidase n=1 Tax=Burkholderia stagnalis TaxID=1503054 RepID=UPI000F7FBE76|nr:M23 family metallopeptidase [Burkholderia stagnalis]